MLLALSIMYLIIKIYLGLTNIIIIQSCNFDIYEEYSNLEITFE
jgi:hypothetical protein